MGPIQFVAKSSTVCLRWITEITFHFENERDADFEFDSIMYNAYARTHLNVFVKKFQIVRLVSAYVWTSELVCLYNANT